MLVETWRPRASVVTTVASPAPLIRNVGQRIGAAIDLRSAALIAVNKQIDA